MNHTCLAWQVSGALSNSIYDQILVLKGLPYMPHLRTQQLYFLRAADIMRPTRKLLRDTAERMSEDGDSAPPSAAPSVTSSSASGSALGREMPESAEEPMSPRACPDTVLVPTTRPRVMRTHLAAAHVSTTRPRVTSTVPTRGRCMC